MRFVFHLFVLHLPFTVKRFEFPSTNGLLIAIVTINQAVNCSQDCNQMGLVKGYQFGPQYSRHSKYVIR